MEQQVYSALNEAKAALKFISANVKDGSQTQRKASDALKKILDVLLPIDQARLNAHGYDPALVYPSNNSPTLKLIEMANENQKPQMQVMQVLQNTAPVAIAELDFVKDKFVKNYNLCHRDQLGELMYHRQLVFFKQAITSSDSLRAADPFSLYACFLTIAVKNYSLDPEDAEVYLFCQDGKKAVIKRQAGAHVRRLMETGQIQYAEQAKIVYQGDVFEVENGRVVKHVEKYDTEIMIAGYVRFVLPGGADRFFVYRKSDWEGWRKKSKQSNGDNWNGNNNQPGAGFMRTKLLKHAATEKCWATGFTAPTVERFDDIEVDEEDDSKLPPVDPNATYQPAMLVSPAGNIQDNSFAAQPAQNGATVTYTDDDF